MDGHVVYADLNLSRGSGPRRSLPPSLTKDVCQSPPWHRCALKLSCAGIILLVLCVIGLSVSVIRLTRYPPTENSSVDVPENSNKTTERPDLSDCPISWSPVQDKCLYFSVDSKHWNDSVADCSRKESSLLLIQDQEELRRIQNLINNKGIYYWIGLNLVFPERKWKWINGSVLYPDILHIDGNHVADSCVGISETSMLSDACHSDNKWICEKKQRPVRNKMCPDS